MREIAFVWFPYFYSAVYRRQNLRDKGRSIIIHRDGQVIGCSSDIADHGLKGLTVAKARGRCPGVAAVAYEAQLFGGEQERYLKVLTDFSPVIEPVSEEECFIDLSGCDLKREMKKLKEKLTSLKLGPVVVGTARNKFLARMTARMSFASSIGLARFYESRVEPGTEERFMKKVPLAMDGGLLPRTLKRLAVLGFESYGEVQGISQSDLSGMLAQDGSLIYRHARGIDGEPLVGIYPPEKMACSFGFDGGLRDRLILEKILHEGSRRLAGLLRDRYKGCRAVRLRVYGEKHSQEALRLVSWGCQEESRMQEVLGLLLNSALASVNEPVTGLSIELSGLYEWRMAEQDLFVQDRKSTRPAHDLAAIADFLREKFPNAILSGLQIDRREQVLALWDPWRFEVVR